MITVFTGPMFSGKSSRLIEIYADKHYNGRVQAFKPAKDTRDKTLIRCRQYSKQIDAMVISSYEDILKKLDVNKKVIMIDEAQFLAGDPRVLLDLSLLDNYEIYVSGLALDSEQNAFGSFPHLMTLADRVEHITADCYYCGREAQYTRYIGEKDEQVLVRF